MSPSPGAAAAHRPDEVIALTSRLVQCHPVLRSSGQPRALDLLERFGSSPGIAVRRLTYTDRDIESDPDYVDVAAFGPDFRDYGQIPRQALVMTLDGAGHGPTVVLNGHVDVEEVPDRAAWQDPDGWSSGRVGDGFVSGRGAADMLGGIASMVCAFRAVARARSRIRGRLVLQLVVDEEIGGNGTLRVLGELPGAEVAVIAEPTANEVRTSTRSFEQFEVRCEGRTRHMTMSRPEDNAVWQAAQVVAAVEEADAWCAAGRPGRGSTAYLCAGRIAGGTDAAVPADQCLVQVTAALPVDIPLSAVLDVVRAAIARRLAGVSRQPVVRGYGLRFPGTPPIDHPAADRLEQLRIAEGFEPTSDREFPSACDARLFHARGIPTVIYGPGSLRDAHGRNERVSVAEIVEHNRLLTRMLMSYLGPADA